MLHHAPTSPREWRIEPFPSSFTHHASQITTPVMHEGEGSSYCNRITGREGRFTPAVVFQLLQGSLRCLTIFARCTDFRVVVSARAKPIAASPCSSVLRLAEIPIIDVIMPHRLR